MNNEKQKSLFEQASQTGGFLVNLLHASVVPLRLVSRVPGSMGAGYLWAAPFGWALMGIAPLFLFPNEVQETQRLPIVLTVTGWLWVIHLFFYFRSHRRGKGTYSHHTGIGWLNWQFPNTHDQSELAIYSDMICALGLAFLCFAGGDAPLGGYFMLSMVLTIVSSALIQTRDAARKRMVSSQMDQQKYWQEIMNLNTEDME